VNGPRIATTLLVSIMCILDGPVGSTGSSKPEGPYLGQQPPGMTPEIFAPGTISKAGFHLHSSLAFSPDGKELCFTKIVFEPATQGTIWCAKQEETGWTEPQPASFSGVYNDDSAVFSPDGKRLYFVSNRPLDGRENNDPGDLNIWFVHRKEGGWEEPVDAGHVLNSEYCDFRLSLTADGRVYLSSDREGQDNKTFDIFVSDRGPDGHSRLEKIGGAVNTPATEQIAFVAPDESYLVLYRYDKKKVDETGLYISFRGVDGSWSVARSLGPLFNAPPEAVTQAASLSHDGKFFFFLRRRHEAIYWVDARAILSDR
jgi:hypothetical protein